MRIWHLLASEFPPRVGGVADYTRLVAGGLAAAGDDVHVWCPPVGAAAPSGRVLVHEELGAIGPADLRRVGRQLDRFPAPRRLLVQWVPHGFGYQSMNLPFCLWLWWRSRVRGDRVEIMVHEPYLAFWEHSLRHAAIALVHRLMTVVLINAAHRVWMAIPAWEARWRPYALGRGVTFTWIPVPAVLTSCPLPDEAGRVRARCGAPDGTLVGHFGTYGPAVAALLAERLTPVLRGPHCPSVLLVGAGSTAFRARFAAAHPDVAPRVHAVDRVPDGEVAQCLAACDLLVQPYPDGISSRRTSAMAGLSLGRPIVTTRGPLTEPIWEASGAVWLSDVADVVSFVAQVDRLLDDAPARQRLGDQARVLYGARFDLRHTISALRASDEST